MLIYLTEFFFCTYDRYLKCHKSNNKKKVIQLNIRGDGNFLNQHIFSCLTLFYCYFFYCQCSVFRFIFIIIYIFFVFYAGCWMGMIFKCIKEAVNWKAMSINSLYYRLWLNSVNIWSPFDTIFFVFTQFFLHHEK